MSNPNQHTRRRYPGWAPWAGAGLVLLAAGTVGYALSGGGESKQSADAFPTKSPDAPITSSQYPEPSPSSIIPSIITSPSTSPSAGTTSPEASPTALPDPWMSRRVAAAHRYGSCTLNSFTNSGVHGSKGVSLELDLDLSADPDSAQLREGGKYNKVNGTYSNGDLAWNSPQIVLYKMDADGKPVGTRFNNANEPDGDVNPTHTTAYIPTGQSTGSVFAVAVETNAITADPNGGHNVTSVDLLCGAVSNPDGGTNWRPYDLGVEVPPVIVNEHTA